MMGEAPDSRVPRYRELSDQIARQIEDGDLAPGAALPPERTLAELHGVSRVTVRKAMETLSGRGLIEQRRGAGTFVSKRVSQPLSVLTSFSEDVAARGMVAKSRLVHSGVGRASPEEVIGLGLAPGHPVTRIIRLRSADGQPLALEAATVLNVALPDPSLASDSLYATLAERGMRPVRAVQRLTAIAIDAYAAGLLEVEPGAPALLITRIGYTAEDRAVEFTRSTFRGDRWDFVAELS
ncbi:transcriptional regulator, GntR family [Palleronia marisminoris]|uniref:HTH-type transcriptional repressor YvoA n=1 Tax=Palleronia marisminoris TaxID=315423 RepID=A0A1Y5S644_9RHOB|nr:GntR family transcriptional regulator [Palleronia marisminoris]SFG63126.1 transcriptional regulator, GntR family [Palleronia marisminoris]SLN32137.1 HTH-type transcriptional repressor YvoA [Palleronia marisminoris]